MDIMSYDPPRSTTTDKSRHKLIRDFLNAERRAKRVQPTDNEMELIRRAAVAISTYSAEDGKKSAFPSACDIVEYGKGLPLQGPNEEPLPASEVPHEESVRQCRLMKLAQSVRRRLDENMDLDATDRVTIDCPVCEKPTLTAEVGTMPAWNEDDGLYPMQEPRIVSLSVECDCTELSPEHYDEIERRALEDHE